MSKTTIQIKTFGGSILFSHESEDNSIKKTLEAAIAARANLAGANLAGAKNIPETYMICVLGTSYLSLST